MICAKVKIEFGYGSDFVCTEQKIPKENLERSCAQKRTIDIIFAILI